MTRKERLEKHVECLIDMRNQMLNSKQWESYKPWIEAVTTGGMAIQRIIREDFEESEDE